ncbi:MAG: trypsin-like peptidase domain-containing protein [Rhodospirillaceae bacterium]
MPLIALIAATGPVTASAAPVDPNRIADARNSVVVVVPAWQGVRQGFAPRTTDRRIAPEGSGIAIVPGGYIATNDHVLGDPIAVDVRLADGRRLPARIVGRHKPSDVALLKIDTDLPVFTIAPGAPVAAPACAIGNPFGRGLSVSCGVISAVMRSNAGFNEIEDFIQTDAAVNPGGSGGALVDGKGRLLGMVSAIFAQGSDVNLGVNFAASAALVRRVVDDLKDHGRVVDSSLGLETGDLPAAAQSTQAGVTVLRTEPNGPAFKAGIEAGDIITKVGERNVQTPAQFRAAAFLAKPGDVLAVTHVRGDKTLEARVIATSSQRR